MRFTIHKKHKQMTTIQIWQKIWLRKTTFTDEGELFLELIKSQKDNDILWLSKAIYDLENDEKNNFSEYQFQTLPK